MAFSKGRNLYAQGRLTDGTFVYVLGTLDKDGADGKATCKLVGAPTDQKTLTLPLSLAKGAQASPVVGYWSTGVVPGSRMLAEGDELDADSFSLKGIDQSETRAPAH